MVTQARARFGNKSEIIFWIITIAPDLTITTVVWRWRDQKTDTVFTVNGGHIWTLWWYKYWFETVYDYISGVISRFNEPRNNVIRALFPNHYAGIWLAKSSSSCHHYFSIPHYYLIQSHERPSNLRVSSPEEAYPIVLQILQKLVRNMLLLPGVSSWYLYRSLH